MIAKLKSIPGRLADIAKKVWEQTWTGFGEHPRNEEVVPAKTLWDFMGVLIVPLVLALGLYFLNSSQRANEQDIAKENRETDREIARDRQHQATLENYFDRMTALMVN